MSLLRKYIRTLLEASSPEEAERTETHKVIQLFLSDVGTLQAIELAEMLPDINPKVVELFSEIKSHVEEIIEYGKGNYPERWNDYSSKNWPHQLKSEEGAYLGPFMKAVRELRNIADKEASGDDESWRESGEGSMTFGKEFQRAMRAVDAVLSKEQTSEEMMASPKGYGKSFVELAERFGIDL